MKARLDRKGVLDCGCPVRLSKEQVAARVHGKRVKIGCGTCRRESYVRKVLAA